MPSTTSTLTQIVIILATLASLLLNIIFVYIPVSIIQAEITKATNNVDAVSKKLDQVAIQVENIAEKIESLINTYESRLDKILAQTTTIENAISNTITGLGLDKLNSANFQRQVALIRNTLINAGVELNTILQGVNYIANKLNTK